VFRGSYWLLGTQIERFAKAQKVNTIWAFLMPAILGKKQ
jgi:hypothetical protein